MSFSSLMVVAGGLWLCSLSPNAKVKKPNAFDKADMRKCTKNTVICGKSKASATTVNNTGKIKYADKCNI